MPKLAIAVVASLVAGFAVAALIMKPSQPVDADAPGFDSNADIDARLRALESAVNVERQARQLLEEEILFLYEELESLDSARSGNDVQLAEAVPIDGSTNPREVRAITRGNRGDESAQRRLALTDAGFSAAQADWIMQREAELRMEALQARYEAMRSGEPMNPMTRFANPDSELRQELGDAQYEMYLRASQRRTAVGVGTVFESSPAQTAGLLPGDQITHYDGTRVFGVFDLTQQAMQGNAGENVVVNITRDGVPMQLVIPRGPLGINAGRGR